MIRFDLMIMMYLELDQVLFFLALSHCFHYTRSRILKQLLAAPRAALPCLALSPLHYKTLLVFVEIIYTLRC